MIKFYLKNKDIKKDYIQLLIDAEASSSNFENNSTNLTNMNLERKLSPNVRFLLLNEEMNFYINFLTFKEVKMNLVLFLLAGYETTSNTLSNCSFILARHPEEQEILLDEIRSHFETVFI
jgi:hypothetical protein